MMKTAVITGGAGGLGRALCAALVDHGWRVAVLDLPSDTLTAMQAERVETHACDLTDEAQTRDTCALVAKAHPAIDLVIYNAGVTQIGAFDDSDIAAHRRLFEINYFTAVSVARHLLIPVRKARGTHLAISSVAGFSPLLKRTAYAASKHALEGFFKSLRAEEKRHGVRCLIAAPSFVATNIGAPEVQTDGLARPGSATDGIDYMSPDEAARIILAGVAKGRAMTPVGRIARLSWLLNRLSPALFERQMEKRIKG